MFSRASKTAGGNRTTGGAEGGRKASKGGMPSIISADLAITGNLDCSGEIQIDGTVTGDIVSYGIVIGQGATVTGSLQAETVRICGKLVGQVTAAQVVLEKTAQVTGDILHRSLSIAEGAFLEGACKRLDSMTTVATQPETVTPTVKAANEAGPAPETKLDEKKLEKKVGGQKGEALQAAS